MVSYLGGEFSHWPVFCMKCSINHFKVSWWISVQFLGACSVILCGDTQWHISDLTKGEAKGGGQRGRSEYRPKGRPKGGQMGRSEYRPKGRPKGKVRV